MSVAPDRPGVAAWRKRVLQFAIEPPAGAEFAVWAILILVTVLIRWWLVHILPVSLWSKDAGSYSTSAFDWVHSGRWETDPRRGAIYSGFIGICLKTWGSFDSLMLAQHILGGMAVLASLVALRVLTGRAALIPLLFCGYAYAVYGLPIDLEQKVRNETLLFFFSSMALASWLFALKCKAPHWLWVTGISAALLTLTKNVFGPFPVVVVLGTLYFGRRALRSAIKETLIFLVAFALPFLANAILNKVTPHSKPPEPQAGILLYGRTAQFTVLDSGIAPDVKARIHSQVEDYRKLPKLDNNVILKQTVVPTIRRYYETLGKTPSDVNHLCKSLAFEAILSHKGQYMRQALGDLRELLINRARRVQSPNVEDVKSAADTLEGYRYPDPLMQVDRTVAILRPLANRQLFSKYYHAINTAWLFRLVPVLLTSLLLPFLFFLSRDSIRLWWLGLASVWYFTLVLLCTVGRPIDRYLLPATPVMFLTLSATLAYAWCAAFRVLRPVRGDAPPP